MGRVILPFAILALAPVPLIALAALVGGPWAWAALAYVTVLSGSVDLVMHRVTRPGDPQ